LLEFCGCLEAPANGRAVPQGAALFICTQSRQTLRYTHDKQGKKMITVIGTATATPDGLALVLDESLNHVARSRAEDGSIDQTLSLDQETPKKNR